MNPSVIRLVALAALCALSFWVGWEWRDRSADLEGSKAQAAAAQGEARAQEQPRTAEQASVRALADIATQHEEDRREAETVPAAVAADLHAGNLRLRREWAGCETQRLSDAAAATRERDALAANRDALAGAIVRAGRDADDQLRACQAVIQSYMALGRTPH